MKLKVNIPNKLQEVDLKVFEVYDGERHTVAASSLGQALKYLNERFCILENIEEIVSTKELSKVELVEMNIISNVEEHIDEDIEAVEVNGLQTVKQHLRDGVKLPFLVSTTLW